MLKQTIIKTVSIAALSTAIAMPAMADDILKKSWAEIEKQAKQEGSVVWYQWFFQPELRKHVKTFEEKYGIKVKIADGTGDAHFNKLLAESTRKVGDIDVMSMGGERVQIFDFKKILLGPIQTKLPQGKQLRTRINGGDAQGYGVAYWGNQTGIAYDSNRVKVSELPQTLADVEKWIKDKPETLGFNFEKGGSGPSIIQNLTRNILGQKITGEEKATPDWSKSWAWFNKNRDNYIITASNADSLVRLNDGELLIAPAWEDHLASLRNKNEVGSHIKFYIPEFGMNGGGNIVTIPKNAKNKAAALVFINWLTSAENQTAFNQKFGTAPMNTKADDSKALASNKMRQYSQTWMKNDFGKSMIESFIENVVQK